MNYKFAKAVGLNTDTDASSVIISSDDPSNIFLGILNFSGEDAFTKGRQFLSDSVDFYLEDRDSSVSERLKAVFEKVGEELKEVDASVILAAISGKVLYITVKGQVKVFLRRVDKVSLLDTSSGQLVSGFLQEGDRIFLSTQNLVDFLGEELNSTLELPASQWEEEMESRVSLDEIPQIPEAEVAPPDEDRPSPVGRAGLIIDVAGEGESEDIRAVYEDTKEEDKVSVEKKITAFVSSIDLGGFKGIFPGGKLRLALAVILILAVAVGMGLKYKNYKDQERINKFNALAQEARDELNEAQGLKILNPTEASSKLSSAKEAIEKALKLKPNDSGAQDLKKQIESSSTSQKFETNFSEYLDLDLVKKGFRPNRLSLSVGKLLLLNPDDSTLVMIDLSKKSQKILSGKDKLGEAKLASMNGDSAFIYSKDKGVLRVDTGNGTASVSAKPDKEWGEIADITGFGGNIYLLDKVSPPAGGQIWKYLSFSGGFSDKRKYLADGVKADFSGASKMQIESSVYVLKSGGEILRFTKGERDNFSIGGLDKGIKEPKSFFVSSDTDNLYVLDSGNSRLVVLNKTGGFVAQYGGDKFGLASDLVVDEKEKKVYLLDGSKLWQMDLK